MADQERNKDGKKNGQSIKGCQTLSTSTRRRAKGARHQQPVVVITLGRQVGTTEPTYALELKGNVINDSSTLLRMLAFTFRDDSRYFGSGMYVPGAAPRRVRCVFKRVRHRPSHEQQRRGKVLARSLVRAPQRQETQERARPRLIAASRSPRDHAQPPWAGHFVSLSADGHGLLILHSVRADKLSEEEEGGKCM